MYFYNFSQQIHAHLTWCRWLTDCKLCWQHYELLIFSEIILSRPHLSHLFFLFASISREKKFLETLLGFCYAHILEFRSLHELDLTHYLLCRSPHSPMTWWRRNVRSIQMLFCAGRRKRLRTRVLGLTCSPALTPLLMGPKTSGKSVTCDVGMFSSGIKFSRMSARCSKNLIPELKGPACLFCFRQVTFNKSGVAQAV
jgi:hypothetical protein